VFNAAYSIELPNPLKPTSNLLARGVVNGWQFSGITQFQTGVNLAANAANNNGSYFNLNTNGVTLANGYTISNLTINGTPNIPLEPIMTCNPTANLRSNQYVNGSCFSLPTSPGHNGPDVLPEFYGPNFFNSDLSFFKNFNFSETKKIQFRFSAYNFVNHPLPTFRNGSSNLNLVFSGSATNMTNALFGTTSEKQGHRILQLALKFYF
jgi:hypothetical protein